MFPSEPEEPTRSDATEDASRLGELKNATRGYVQIEADANGKPFGDVRAPSRFVASCP